MMLHKWIKDRPGHMCLVLAFVISAAVAMVTSVNPGKEVTPAKALEEVVQNPLSLPFSMLTDLLVPDSYAQWRKTSVVMDKIENGANASSMLAFLALVIYLFMEFWAAKQYEEMAIRLGVVALIPGLWVYLHAVAYLMLDNLFDLVFLVLLLPVGAVVFSLPSFLFFTLGLVDKQFIDEGKSKVIELVFPSANISEPK